MKRTSLFLLAACALAAAPPRMCFAVVSFTGAAYTQTFDGLANTGTTLPWTNDSTLPGWFLFKLPATPTPPTPAPIATYNAGTGSSNSGVIYSFGADAASTERALGGVASTSTYWGDGSSGPATGAVAGWIAVALTNNTAETIDEVSISFDGEQWRNGGGTTPTAQTMVLEWGLGATFATVAAWTAPGGNFDWTSPVVSTTAGAVDGNDAGKVANRGGVLSSLPWTVGSNLWIRWIERNDIGNDHGLAIDDFELSIVSDVVEADFDGDLDVDGDDFLIWQRGLGTGTTNPQGNTNPGQDSDVDADDLATWAAGFGLPVPTITAIPEPSAIVLALAGLAAVGGVRRRASAN